MKKAGKEIVVRELIDKKRGRPLLLGKEMDKEVHAYIIELRVSGCPINTAIVIATGVGIVKHCDSNLLFENGGDISLTKDWAKYFLHRMSFIKRRSSSAAEVSVTNFVQLKSQFLYDIQSIVEMEDIPSNLIINWDHTTIKYIPVSNWTMADEGSQRVEVAGADDKRQIIAVFGITLSGDFLPPQSRHDFQVSAIYMFSNRLGCKFH